MSRLVRCRRCGSPLVLDRFAPELQPRRLCPHYRGPRPPAEGLPARAGGGMAACAAGGVS